MSSSFLHAVLILTAPPNVWLELTFEVLSVYILIYYYLRKKKQNLRLKASVWKRPRGRRRAKTLIQKLITVCMDEAKGWCSG